MKKNEIDPSNRNCQRILLAEDYEVNQKIGQLFLQNAGYRVDIAENGQQAVEAYQQSHYDLILMDIQMPVMDGYAATREIRELESKIQNPKSEIDMVPIIAMTGNISEASLDADNNPGINECIRKPAQWDQVLLVVQKWIDAEFSASMDKTLKGVVSSPVRKTKEYPFPLDLDKAIEEFMGQKEILFGILQDFVNLAETQVENIRRAVDCSDYGIIVTEAHAIKGGAANLTAYQLADLAADLEKAAIARKTDQTVLLAEKLENEYYNLETFLRPKLRTK